MSRFQGPGRKMGVFKIKWFWLSCSVICVGRLSALLIGGGYFESSCDFCLYSTLVANRKTRLHIAQN